jgi:hypothetical protein
MMLAVVVSHPFAKDAEGWGTRPHFGPGKGWASPPKGWGSRGDQRVANPPSEVRLRGARLNVRETLLKQFNNAVAENAFHGEAPFVTLHCILLGSFHFA